MQPLTSLPLLAGFPVTWERTFDLTGSTLLRFTSVDVAGDVGTTANPLGAAIGPAGGARSETIDIQDAIEVAGQDPAHLFVHDEFAASHDDVTAVVRRDSCSVRVADFSGGEHAADGLVQNAPEVATTGDEFLVACGDTGGGQRTLRIGGNLGRRNDRIQQRTPG